MRAFAKLVLVASLMLVTAVAIATWVLRRPSVSSRVAVVLAEVLSDRETRVSLHGLSGALPFAPDLALLEIADRRGVWLRVEGLSLAVDSLALLGRRVHLRSIAAERVTVLRAPEASETPFELAPLRLTVDVDRLRAPRVLLGRELLDLEEGPELSAPLAIEAHGKVDLRRLTLDVEATASTRHLDDVLRSIGLRSSAARATIALRGAIAAPGGTVTVSAGNVRVGEFAATGVDVRGEIERLGHADRGYAVRVGARTSGVRLAAPYDAYVGAAPELRATVRFGETPRIFDLDELRLETATFAAEIVAASDGTDLVRVTRSVVTVPELRAIAELADHVEAGAARIRGTGDVRISKQGADVRIDLDAETIDLQLRDPVARAVAGSEVSGQAELHWQQGCRFVADEIEIHTAVLDVKARAEWTSDAQMTARALVAARELDPFSALAGIPLSGTAHVDIDAAGPVDRPELSVDARTERMRIGDLPPIHGTIGLRARHDGATTAGIAEARLTLADVPVRVDGEFAYDAAAGSLSLDRVDATLPGVSAVARGRIDVVESLAQGTVALRADDLAALGAWVSVPVSGDLSVDVTLEHDGRVQGGRLVAATRSLRLGDLETSSSRVEAERATQSAETRFEIDTVGRYVGEFALRAGGTHRGSLEDARIDLDRLDGRVARHAVALRRPLRVARHAGGTATIAGGIGVAGGIVEGEWRGDLRTGVGHVRFAELPLELLEFVSAQPKVTGVASGELARERVGDDIDVRVRTAGAGIVSAAAPGGVSRFDLDLTGDLGTRRSKARGAFVSGDAQSRFQISVDAPVGLDGIAVEQALDSRLEGVVSADLIGHLLLAPDDRLSGEISIDLALGGLWREPRLDGGASGSLRYVNAATGFHLRVDEIAVRAEGQRMQIAALRGGDGREGRFEGDGEIDFSEGWSNPDYVVNVAFEDTYLARIDELQLRGDGNVTLSGSGPNLALRGDFAADEALIRIPSRLPPDIASLSVVHSNREHARWHTSRDDDDSSGPPVALDLRLRFPSRLRVDDPNLDSEWRGELFVRGTTQAIQVDGALAVTRGTIALGGVRFRTREGSLSFDEGGDVPVLDLTAVAVRNEVEATLRLTGRIDRLAFSLSSEPPLPQDEILSRLMFGSSATTLTAGQAVQLAQAVARLSGRGAGMDPLSRVRRLVGVDRIEIRETEGAAGPETAVSVGKYVTDRVYVSVDQPVAGEGSKARVEVEVSKHISAETEVGQDENARIGINWRWNY